MGIQEQVRRYNEWIQSSPGLDDTTHQKVSNHKYLHVSFEVDSSGNVVPAIIPDLTESSIHGDNSSENSTSPVLLKGRHSDPARPRVTLRRHPPSLTLSPPFQGAGLSRLSSDMRARISQFEDLDRQSFEWKAVRLRAKRQEEEHRRVVSAARRSLHLDVHVGGGEYAPSIKSGAASSSSPSKVSLAARRNLARSHKKPSITDLVQASTAKNNRSFRGGVASASTLLEASLLVRIPLGNTDDRDKSVFTDDHYGTLNRLQATFGAAAIAEWFREYEAPHLLHFTFRNGDVLRIPTWFHGPLKRLPSEALLRGRLANSFLVRISDSFLGYIVSHIAANGACTHVFLHLLKPLNTQPDDDDGRGDVINGVDGSGVGVESRFYHLQGQRKLFPSLLDLVEYYKDHSIVNGDEELYLIHPVGQSIPPAQAALSLAAAATAGTGARPVADYSSFLFYCNDSDVVTAF